MESNPTFLQLNGYLLTISSESVTINENWTIEMISMRADIFKWFFDYCEDISNETYKLPNTSVYCKFDKSGYYYIEVYENISTFALAYDDGKRRTTFRIDKNNAAKIVDVFTIRLININK